MADSSGKSDDCSKYQNELEQERDYVARLYQRIDIIRAEKQEQLKNIQARGSQGTFQNQSERDSFASLYQDRIHQLDAVEERLVFGRLDTVNGQSRHIGRLGISNDERTRLLIDWRAPEAAPFYQATAANPLNVTRRRHIMMTGRHVESFEDDVLHIQDGTEVPQALLSAITAPRTGVMGDIVGTIQREQDEIIRDELRGVLVVQGGPGTGKTAVALHRAAYLLYTHRERLAKTGVLLVGPSVAFMNYIDQVLPSLGETGVVMKSIGDLYPGIRSQPEPNSEIGDLKGRAEMHRVVANAVSLRQRNIQETTWVYVDGTKLRVRPAQIRRAINHARASGKPHNEAREVFVDRMVQMLYDQLRDIISPKRSDGLVNKADRSYLHQEIRQSKDVRRLLNLCWMPLTPIAVIDQLLSDPQYLVNAAPMLSSHEILKLLRPSGSVLTQDDIPLIDEAAELLGETPTSLGANNDHARQRQRNLETAEAALDNMFHTLEDIGVDGIVTPEMLAAAQETRTTYQSVADRATADRTWTYGHIIVDEAQELSYMQWRMLFRRSPLRSLTIVGDLAQASNQRAHHSWQNVLADFAGDQWRLSELTVNYRTPGRITSAAARVSELAQRSVTKAVALREGDFDPRLISTDKNNMQQTLLDVVSEERARLPDGLIGVIATDQYSQNIIQTLIQEYPEQVWTGIGRRGSRNLIVVTPKQAKGLEYDAVIIYEPQTLVQESNGSVGDLYVAMTRSTQTLSLITSAQNSELPAGLQDL